MLETSRDLLNIMLGSSVLLVAILFSWVLYQGGRAMKGINDTIKVVENIAKNVDEGVKTFKDKAGNAAAFLTVLMKGGQEFMKTMQKKKASKTTKKKASKK